MRTFRSAPGVNGSSVRVSVLYSRIVSNLGKRAGGLPDAPTSGRDQDLELLASGTELDIAAGSTTDGAAGGRAVERVCQFVGRRRGAAGVAQHVLGERLEQRDRGSLAGYL